MVERQEAAIGVFVTLEEPTKDMITGAVSAGFYKQGEKGNNYANIGHSKGGRMTDKPKNDPRTRRRGGQESPKSSPLTRTPRKAETTSSMPADEEKQLPPLQTVPPDQSPPGPASASPFASGEVSTHRRFNFGPPFWTIASILSFTINLALIIALLVVWMNAQKLIESIGGATNMGNFLLGGLYTNFEKMDRAHITTNIGIETTVPVKFDLQLIQQTNVVLSQDVTITNALVTVNTDGLNISRANTTIVLPAGTTLPIVLNMTIPVDTTVPITLIVPIDIPLGNTQLHEPLVGLQEVVRPLYCIVEQNALNLSGAPVCP